MFFSLIARRLEEHHIQKNRIINLSIQKGCVAKVPGCWEHMSLLWNELKTGKSNKTSITAAWLDIANAYGSIPHLLIFYSFKHYGINPTWIDLLNFITMVFGVNPSPPKQHLVGKNILGEFSLGVQFPSFYFWQE